MNSHNMFNLEKLNGRDNFSTWKFSVKTYLEHEGLWKCVEPHAGYVIEPAKDILAKSKLILLVNSQNYVHIQECETARQVWINLHKAFDDNGLTRKVGLLKELINTSLESSSGIEEYVSKIMSAAHKLRNINFEVNDEWLGTLMLAGLPDQYKPMMMALENSGVKISADLIKTKLLQEIEGTVTNSALYSHGKKGKHDSVPKAKPGKGPRCFNCNGYGHFAKSCLKKKKQLNYKQETSSFAAAFSAMTKNNNEQWYIDSGASMHMCNCKEDMYNLHPSNVKSITVANSEPLSVEAAGDIDVNILQGGKILLRNVLYVPGLTANLISVSTITRSGYKVTFNDKGCNIYDVKRKLICSATLNNKLYALDMQSEEEKVHLSSTNSNDVKLWHLRMAHLNVSDVQKLSSCADDIALKHNQSKIYCSSCLEGKQSRLPFKHSSSRATKPLELIHSDLCGPMENSSYGGMRYFISFIDDYSRMVHVYFTKDKLSVLDVFKDFKRRVENQLNTKIKILRTDNGKEYCNNHFDKYLMKCGIIHQTSTPYSPQQNGLAERMNRTLVEKARCMISHANLEKPIWAEAIATAAYIVNRSPTKGLDGTTPYEMWKGHKPKLSHMRIFGSEVMVHIPKEKRQKWDKKSQKMIFTGYCESTKGYRVMHPKTHQVLKSRDVVFFEKTDMCDEILISARSSLDRKLEQDDHQESDITSQPTRSLEEAENESGSEYETDTAEDLDESYCPPRHTSVQESKPHEYAFRPRNKDKKKGMLCFYTNLTDPKTVEEALASPDVEEWKKAMDNEINSLIKNDTWKLVNLPSGKTALPSKWVFKRKTNNQGNVTQFKARLVIKGYAQRRGVDYQEVYSPVVRWTSMRYLFALAAQRGLHIHQMDAVSAFLQGSIDTDIYMQQPELYNKGNEVCHLNKSIYGLKQASRLWNLKLSTILKEMNVQQSKTDPCVYYNISMDMYIAVWVDDIMLFASDIHLLNNLKKNLQQKLCMKDLGEVNQCLGLNITRTEECIMLDQEKYIKDILTKFNMSECKPVKTPMEVGLKFTEQTDEEMFDCPYQQAIGSLLYVAQGTRPDISYTVNALSRFNNKPRSEHWAAVKRVMRYLQGTKDYKLVYTKTGNTAITGYCDADWASDTNDRKSCTGYIFMLQGGAISWCSRKQQTIALSTAEAEYMAMGSAAQEALWLRQLQAELGGGSDTLLIHSDNQSAIKLSTNDCYMPRFYDPPQTNGSHEDYPPQAKRAASSLFLNPSPFLYPLPSNASLFDYGHPYHTYHGNQEGGYERRDGGITVRDVNSMNAPFAEPRGLGAAPSGLLKTDDEWKNINTMLNCILSMVEKTKRALAILQQRGVEPTESNEIKRAASEIMATAVRQTEERVAEVRRRAEDAVNQVKRQALLELQRAVGAAETKALELVAAERGKVERLGERRHSPPPGRELSPNASSQQNCCWNCGRKAQETCSGCNAARYCGAFCQHKDWENHHQVCSGRDQKPTALRTSPPTTQPSLPKPLTRATTPIAAPTSSSATPLPDSRLSLTSLNSAERLLTTQERTDRLTLASLSSAQGLIGIGKK